MNERIRKKRLELGLTQEELGKLMGVNRQAVNKWEKGRVQSIPLAKIRKLAVIFNVSLMWLISGDEYETGLKRDNVWGSSNTDGDNTDNAVNGIDCGECRTCPRYDKEEHNCPLWCKVVRETVEDVRKEGKSEEQQRIIAIMEDNWLHGTVARRVIDEIIDQIKEVEE